MAKKLESVFKIESKFEPSGDQPEAILSLLNGLKKGYDHQTLFGATGTGKTFTAANVIKEWGKPTLVIAHNKTLAAQLAQEYKEFFPHSAVHYFVSYYDYYQPEAYMPVTDTYIEKEAMINVEIDRLRHASTQALLTRQDVIVVASVSCIYGLGSPEEYMKEHMKITVGQTFERNDFIRALVSIHYKRTNADLSAGVFRVMGNAVEMMPVNEKTLYKFELREGIIASIGEYDPISFSHKKDLIDLFLFPAKHFVTDKDKLDSSVKNIEAELKMQLKRFDKEGKILEAERLKRRTKYDIAMLKEVGYVNGIENYSRHLSGKLAGEPPDTLLSYFPKTKDGKPDFLTIVDESHVAIPQIRGMFEGDASRKRTLIEHGFRLPSAADNRPLRFEEFKERVGQVIYTSATPAQYEKDVSKNIAEQLIRPTGLIDPKLTVRGIQEKGKYKGQVHDFIDESLTVIKGGGRVLATTLTKKMAEDLTDYLKAKKIKTQYIHSDVETIDRIEILTNFRKGEFDCLVGVNLLREGLDLPEVELIGILDADKEGFLRSETSLIQTIGRAARNVKGHVILYAEKITGSMKRAMDETERRRNLQIAYNKEHGITPKTILKAIHDIADTMRSEHSKAVETLVKLDTATYKGDVKKILKAKEKQMNKAVKELDFETAALLRDEIKYLTNTDKK